MSELAQTPSYTMIVGLEKTTDGAFCYVARHPELPTVMGQGETAKEAKEDLAEATELAIEHLLRNNMPIPEPIVFGADKRESPAIEVKYALFTPLDPEEYDPQAIVLPSPEMVTV